MIWLTDIKGWGSVWHPVELLHTDLLRCWLWHPDSYRLFHSPGLLAAGVPVNPHTTGYKTGQLQRIFNQHCSYWCFSTKSSVATVLSTHPFISSSVWMSTLRPNIFITTSLRFVSIVQITISQHFFYFFEVMAWWRRGNKPLFQPVMA